MEELLHDLFNLSAFLALATWVTIDLTWRKPIRDREARRVDTNFKLFCRITLGCSILNTFVYFSFCCNDLLKMTTRKKMMSLSYVFTALSWLLATTFAFYYDRGRQGRTHTWPKSLRAWWLYVLVSNIFSLWSSWQKPFFSFFFFPSSVFLGFVAIFSGNPDSDDEPPGDLRTSLVQDAERSGGGKYSDAGLWSRLLFRWMNPLFESGRAQRLDLCHVPPVTASESAEESYYSLQESLAMKKSEAASSLRSAIFRSLRKPLAINAIFAGINTISSYMGLLLITTFVDFLYLKKTSNQEQSNGYILASIFFLAKMIESLSQRQFYFGAHRIGIQVRAALMVSIYNKSLASATCSVSSATGGRAINLLDVDVERIGDFFWYLHGVWLTPIQVCLALIILYRNLGVAAAISALVATLLVMVSNTPLARSQEKLHSKILESKDSRMKATAEILKCMRILKLHSWENSYMEKLLLLRDSEQGFIKKYLYTCSAIAFLFWASPVFISAVSFGVCIFMGSPLTPSSVFSALATFRILQEPIYNMPELISMFTQTKVSIDRIESYLNEYDQQHNWNSRAKHKSRDPNIAVEINPGEYSWGTVSTTTKTTLKIEKELKIEKGELVVVCGPVGSGKSTLLSSLIGEIPRIKGEATRVFGSTAYVPQSYWIQTGTVRDNVLFGKEMEGSFYEEVIKSCALDLDIAQWAGGDMAMVGEKGVNLSGGQKQRIQLARAIYSNSCVFFLDDPFSAVDAHTRAHLFKECLMRLLRHKTVILATHEVEFLEAATVILVMKEGRIVQSGKYKDLIEDTNGQLAHQVAAQCKSLIQNQPTKPNKSQKIATYQTREIVDKGDSETQQHTSNESGRVKFRAYLAFVTAAYNGGLVPVVLLCQLLFQGFQIASNFWISWATGQNRVSKKCLIGTYVFLSGVSSVFILGRAVLLSTIAVETSQKLFVGMIRSIFRAPISFFDSTPSSWILNRSSTDQSIVDTDIPYRLAGLAFALVQLLCVIILMSSVVWPLFLLFIIIFLISYWYQSYYISTARELARMVGIRKSAILQHFTESTAGVSVIRSFNKEDRFTEKNLSIIDDYSRVVFHNSASMEWLSARINFLFNIIFFILLIIVVVLPSEELVPSLAGLAVTYALSLNELQAWVIWNLCNVENKMISVERILNLSTIKNEAPLVIESFKPEQGWPQFGTIIFDDIHVQYHKDLPMVLKGISCELPGEKKIGVVGRTGSGKSTLIQAIFRMVECSRGKILIDGVDIQKLGLHDLRSRLSVIPQEPTLFQGDLRGNLDPLQQYSDSEICKVLQICKVSEMGKGSAMLLEASVAEDGENWSVGQRQLVCLARVLLQKRKILVLDEATASVDTLTDNTIQKIIREEANSCTVIMIAHRIPTIIDSDLVLVLDEGRVLEMDSPANLLRDGSSAFSKLVKEYLGNPEYEELELPE